MPILQHRPALDRKEPVPAKNRERPFQVNRSRSMASKKDALILQNTGTDSDRPEMSLIVNGGHYMTRGHVILVELYIKTFGMSRTILE